jgi:hypothetical protein
MLTFFVLLLASPDIELAAAKNFTFNGYYEESDKILTGRKQNNLYHLCKMINAFHQNNKKLAEKHLITLENSFEELPIRYDALIYAVRADLEHWSLDGLDDIGRDMRHSKHRLKVAKGGKKTQAIQDEILKKLDKKINDLEEKANPNSNSNTQTKTTPKKVDNPLEDLRTVDATGKGIVDDKKLKVIADSWGTMPPKDKLKVIHDLTKDLPARYRIIIEDYFRALANVEKK